MQEAVIQDTAPRRLVSIFSDETGKNDRYVIVASVWMLEAYAMFSFTKAVLDWKTGSPWATREIHFARFGKSDLEPLKQYIGIVNANRQYLGFKFLAVERAKTRRSIEDVVAKLHEHMLISGAEHEISTGRIDLPREINVSVDEEQSLDPSALAEMKRRVNEAYTTSYGDRLSLMEVKSASSRKSAPIQLADVLAGALNRHLNHDGERNVKDEYADLIISELGLTLEKGDLADLDASAFFFL